MLIIQPKFASEYQQFHCYSKDVRWLDSLNDKWNDYANFFVGGFLEVIYSINDRTYAQIDAKLIDYDVRFRHLNHQTSITTTPRKQVNTFALRRNESASKSVFSPRTSLIIIDDTQEFDDSNKRNLIIIDDDESAIQPTTDNDELSKFVSYYKKFKESEKQDQSSRTTSSTTHSSPTPTYRLQKRKLSDLCNLEESDNDPDNDPNDLANNPAILNVHIIEKEVVEAGEAEEAEVVEEVKRPKNKASINHN
ncbi:hypothetical protein GLOIN_2v1797865 [Rhizophagus irregularis DAOM 181602=DAOM 197198]|nr:hypothetical protein GLOIN_2v1797865 [Rhizophagus irregularis DAOM 181602=DAOM 197198]